MTSSANATGTMLAQPFVPLSFHFLILHAIIQLNAALFLVWLLCRLQELGLLHPRTAVAFAFKTWNPLQPQQITAATQQQADKTQEEQQEDEEAAAQEDEAEEGNKGPVEEAAGEAAAAAVLADPITTTMAWELLFNILEQLEDRKLGSQEALAACRQEVSIAEDKLSEAGAAAATAAAELDQQQAEQEQQQPGQGGLGGRQRIPAFGGGGNYGGEMSAEQKAQGAARREAVAARNLARVQAQLVELQGQGPALQQELVDTLREVRVCYRGSRCIVVLARCVQLSAGTVQYKVSA